MPVPGGFDSHAFPPMTYVAFLVFTGPRVHCATDWLTWGRIGDAFRSCRRGPQTFVDLRGPTFLHGRQDVAARIQCQRDRGVAESLTHNLLHR